MNKIVSLGKFSKKAAKLSYLDKTSVIIDKQGVPLGFVFGRDSFITFLESIDSEFERLVKDPHKAFQNPAGKLIDLIEEKLPLNPDFIKDLKETLAKTKKMDWIPMEEVMKSLHV